MKHYAVVVLEGTYGKTEFTFNGRQPFISTSEDATIEHLEAMQKMWPNEKYAIVSFEVPGV